MNEVNEASSLGHLRQLTAQQRAMALLEARGTPAQEIAAGFGVSVQHYRQNIRRKEAFQLEVSRIVDEIRRRGIEQSVDMVERFRDLTNRATDKAEEIVHDDEARPQQVSLIKDLWERSPDVPRKQDSKDEGAKRIVLPERALACLASAADDLGEREIVEAFRRSDGSWGADPTDGNGDDDDQRQPIENRGISVVDIDNE